MFAPALQKQVSVEVTGNSSGYNSAMISALANTSKFNVGVTAAIAAVVALGTAMGGMAVKSAASFQAEMSKVKAISGAVGKEFRALENEAKRLGQVTQFTMVQIAGGMENLARAGLSATEIITTMGGVTALAASQGIELSEAAKVVTRAMKGMGLATSDADRIANVFAATAASANLNISELSEAFTIFAPLARTLKMPIEEVSGMIGALADVGLTGSKATTVLATAMSRLAAPPKAAADMLKKLNIEIWDAQGQFVGMVPLVSALEEKFKGLTDQQQAAAVSAIFGQRAFKNWMSLINSGGDALSGLIAEVTGTNAAFEQQATMIDNVSGAWVILTSSISAGFQALGEPVLGVVQKSLEYITRMVNILVDKIRSGAPYIKAFFETMYNYVSVNREAIGFLIKQIGNMAMVVGVIAGVALAFKMLMSPVLWLTAAAFAFYAAWMSNLFGVQEKIDNFASTLADIVSAPIKFILNMTGQDESAENVGNFFDGLVGKISAIAVTGILAKALLNGLVGGGTLTGGGITLGAIAIGAHFIWSISNIMDAFETGGLESAISAAVPTVGGILGAILGTMVGGPIGTIVGYTAGTLLGKGINFVVKVAAEYIWDIENKVGSVDNLMGDYPIQNPSLTVGGGSGAVEIPALIMFDVQGFMNEQADAAAGNGYIPGTYTPVGKALGGFIPGTGTGDIVPAMLEPGEFVIPKWMMEIQEVRSLITNIWSSGKRMATGGPVGFSGGSGGGGVPAVWNDILSTLTRLESWFKDNAVGDEGKAWVDENFGALKELIISATGLGTEFQTLLDAAKADASAFNDLVDETNKQAEAAIAATIATSNFSDSVQTASQTLSKVRGYLSQMPGLLGEVASGLVGVVQAIQENDWGGIANAIGQIFLSILRDKLDKLRENLAELNEQLDELKKIEAFYIGAMQTIGNVMSSVSNSFGFLGPLGSALSTTIKLITDSFAMLPLNGIDLLNAGLATLSTLVTSLVGIFSDLISRSDSYSAVQKESESIWKTVGNMLGEFLWPLVGAIRYLKEWLGIQEDVNDTLREVGVPSMFKRDRRAFESASPGQLEFGPDSTDIPSWAEALGQSLGETIRSILESFGFNSLDSVLGKIQDAATALYTWIISTLPTLIDNLSDLLQGVWDVLVNVYDWGVNLWNEAGGWSGILAKWDEFKDTLGTLPTWTEIQDEITRIVSAIAGVEAAIKGVEAAIKTLSTIIGIASAILAVLQSLGGLSGIISGISNLVKNIGSAFGIGGGAASAAGAAGAASAGTAGAAGAGAAGSAAGAAGAGAIMSGTPAQLAQLAGSGVGTIAQAVASAAVPIIIGTQSHEQIKKTDKTAKKILSPVLNVVESVNDTIHKIFPSKKDKERASGTSSKSTSWTCPKCGLWRSKNPGSAGCPNCGYGKKTSSIGNVISNVSTGIGNVVRNISSGIGGFFKKLGFAEGGLITKPTFGVIGEGKHAEGVFPLSQDTFNRFSVGIVKAMDSLTGSSALSPSLSYAGNNSPKVEVYNEVIVYLGETDVTDLVIDGVQSRSRSISGSRSSASAITRRR